VVPTEFQPFFTASVAASAGLIGLLFVSVSIAPERVFGPASEAVRQAQALSAFTALANIFFISMTSLIPRILFGIAVTAIAVMTVIGLLLGDSLLVPVTEVGSMASAFGWLATCVSFFVIEKDLRARIIAGTGAAVSLLLLLMKLVPAFPGHFSNAEWVALAIWLALGLAFYLVAARKK